MKVKSKEKGITMMVKVRISPNQINSSLGSSSSVAQIYQEGSEFSIARRMESPFIARLIEGFVFLDSMRYDILLHDGLDGQDLLEALSSRQHYSEYLVSRIMFFCLQGISKKNG